jgi:hypothetical protein
MWRTGCWYKRRCRTCGWRCHSFNILKPTHSLSDWPLHGKYSRLEVAKCDFMKFCTQLVHWTSNSFVSTFYTNIFIYIPPRILYSEEDFIVKGFTSRVLYISWYWMKCTYDFNENSHHKTVSEPGQKDTIFKNHFITRCIDKITTIPGITITVDSAFCHWNYSW